MAGAPKDNGLGNRFHANIRATGGIVNVVHVAGKDDQDIPDIETINTEMEMSRTYAVTSEQAYLKLATAY